MSVYRTIGPLVMTFFPQEKKRTRNQENHKYVCSGNSDQTKDSVGPDVGLTVQPVCKILISERVLSVKFLYMA